MKIKILSAISVVIVMLSLNCSHPTQTAGNGSGTGNAVVGILYQSDGKTPATGVRVHIRPKTSLADTSGAGMGKRLAILAVTDSVVTDSAGRFAFDTTIDTGTYVITGASGNNAVLIDSVAIKNKTVTDSLAPDTLKPAGALKGVIRLSEGGDPRKVFVLAFGIDRFAKVNLDGSFKFASLAEAKYDLRLISGLDNYGVLDTNAIPVRSADTTNLDTISLPFTGIPTPTGLKAVYDTTTGKIFLSWNRLSYGIVGGYIVYRNDTSSTIPVNISGNAALKDTFFVDSVIVNPFDTNSYNFQYRLKAQDTATNLGTKYSDPIGVSFKIYPIWSTVGDLSSTSAFSFEGFALDNNGVPYVGFFDYNTVLATVMKYNGTNWVLVGQVGFSNVTASHLWDIKFDHNNIPYLSTKGLSGAEIWRFNGSAWALIGSLGDVTDFSIPMAINDSNQVYVAIVRDSPVNCVLVQKYDAAGWSNVGDTVFAHVPTGAFRANASLALDNSGVPYVVAIDENNGNKCSVKKFNGATWEYVGTPGFSTGTVVGISSWYQIQIVMDNAGTPYVAFNNSIQAEVWRFNNSAWERLNSQSTNGYVIQLFFAGNKPYVNISYDLYQYSSSVWKLIPAQVQENYYAGDPAGDVFLSYRGGQSPYPIKVMKLK